MVLDSLSAHLSDGLTVEPEVISHCACMGPMRNRSLYRSPRSAVPEAGVNRAFPHVNIRLTSFIHVLSHCSDSCAAVGTSTWNLQTSRP
jgi:hypothetical protein